MAVGGTEDHVHLLLAIPATIPVAKALQLIKGNSSKWVKETWPHFTDFAWQEGYGAFSIGVSQVAATLRYIQGQERHHKGPTFDEEFVLFLRKHSISFDPRYVFD